VMTRLLQQTRDALGALPAETTAIQKLQGLLRWTLQQRLAGGVPHLPSTSPMLQQSLLGNQPYMQCLIALSEEIGELIQLARSGGSLNGHLRDEFVLYTLYARTCDPTLDFLKAGGSMTDDEIVDQMVTACFDGLGC
jgi:TetR/AcrR family transcriptional regulator, regulator of autoinduction and epiphytic fitness